MVSAANWLDELGIPPREVCLDWAWQLQSHFAKVHPAVGSEPADLRWQRIEVSPHGELLLPTNLQDYSPLARLRELVTWARSEVAAVPNQSEPLANHNSDELLKELRKLTASCIAGGVQDTNQLTASTSSTPPSTTDEASDSLTPFAEQLSSQHSVRLRRKSRSDSHAINRIVGAVKQHKLAASLIASGLALVCILTVYYRPGSARKGEVALSNKVAISQDAVSSAVDDVNESSSDLDDASALATIPEMPKFEVSEPEARELAPVVMPSISSSRIAGVDQNLLDSSTIAGAAGTKAEATIAVTQTELQPSAAGNPRASSETFELKNQDVMQELDALTKSAANSAHDSDLPMPDAMDANSSTDAVTDSKLTGMEPLMLSTSPMNQTQKIASKVKARPRQPVWQIRLAVDDEFELSPKEPQDVTERQITTWFLSDSDANSPMVRLVIQAQAAAGRQATLRWRVFASAEDLPDLMLPLDKELLNPLQDRLRFYAQASQREADRLKQLASVADRDVRAAMNKQRVYLEAQSKLASRVSTVVAEARLLDDLLRSQLTVHAQLLDGADSAAPPMLQFGDPSNLQADESTDVVK